MVTKLTINNKEFRLDVEPRHSLAHTIREKVGLTGTKIGCDSGQCGSCIVMLDGKSVKSCMVLAVQAHDCSIQTVEGISENRKLNSIQEGLHKYSAVQCGYCIPGVIMTLTDMMSRNKQPDTDEIRDWLHGNFCRCTGYQNLVEAARYAIDKESNSTKIITNSKHKKMYEERVRLLMAGDVDKLVEEHYNDDAIVMAFDFVVQGKENLKEHFKNFVKWVSIKEVISTDKFVETENAFFYEATAVTNYGEGRVYDAYYLKNGKIQHHFTGLIE
ncbi:MAG: (2Fe-2S)-binding protein [Saprospiraceae bacterium]|jgi:carbon-monoxide dehydrogenase small subunit|nr:(2Fe-2S)-binding protein [Saprospiraceae bacterium]